MKAGIVAIACVAVLSGCARLDGPVESTEAGFRRTGTMIASKALFDPAKFAGSWQVVAAYPTVFDRDCAANRFAFAEGAATLTAEYHCEKSGTWTGRRSEALPNGPGRLRVDFGADFPTQDLWILWTDETYRTAVIGTPNGKAGWIVNRDSQIPADRLKAAREILDFNGYDLSQLQARTR